MMTVLVRCGESEALADLFYEVIKSTWKGREDFIQWQLPYAFVDLPPHINLDRFGAVLDELGMTLWLAIKTNDDDGHGTVVYNRKGIEVGVDENGITLMQKLIELGHNKKR
jgi:hypothetical protein